MDPKMLELIRLMTGLDNKLLPDSMSTEDFGKFIDDQKGKLFGTPEDIINLQKIISKKDVDFTKTKEALEKLKIKKLDKDPPKEDEKDKKIKELGESVKKLTDAVNKSNTKAELEDLGKKYPDILPRLLQGKTEEDQEKIVEEQRAMNKKNYGDAKKFTQPTYTDVADVDKEIQAVKDDKSMGSVKQGVKILQLERIRTGIEESSLESE